MKKILSLLLVFAMLFSLSACTGNENTQMPQTPQNIAIDDNALITWDAVDGASGYVVTIDNTAHSVNTNSYQATAAVSFSYSVRSFVKTSSGSLIFSAASEKKSFVAKPAPISKNIEVSVVGCKDIEGGSAMQLLAVVTNAEDQSVTWSIIEGADAASVNSDGLISTVAVEENTSVTVEARSNADNTKFDRKTFIVGGKPVITQEMLDELTSSSKMSFSGYVTISMYSVGTMSTLQGTQSLPVSTKFDGSRWYAEYTDTSGSSHSVYCENYQNKAALVGVSYTNEELYQVMTDDNGDDLSWDAAGYYNNFVGLKASDFQYNSKTGFFDYVGSDANLPAKMIASANPYDFKVDGFSLLVENGAITGLYAKSSDDYSILSGYRCVQELVSMFAADDSLEVPTIDKFPELEWQQPLAKALEKMKSLQSYTVDMMDYSASIYSSAATATFKREIVTSDTCMFVPYTLKDSSVADGETNRNYDYTAETTKTSVVGYRKINENLYNRYTTDSTGKAVATKAFDADFSEAKLSFDFSAAIFTSYSTDSDGNTTYYVNSSMYPVTTLFYGHTDNYSALYGMFATAYTSSSLNILPSVTVNKEGYIVGAQFYYNMTYMYGVVDITYGNFDQATLPSEISFDGFEARNVPTSWQDAYFVLHLDSDKDEDCDLKDYLAANYTEDVPFFGSVLGDSYGFAMVSQHTSASQKRMYESIYFYYDVPLDDDATINSSLEKVKKLLVSLGFEENSYGEFQKDTLWVQVVDEDLDLLIYVWSSAEKVEA